MVDYSKWSHIEVSDDEDDTHPNIDTPSLFRWRHKARVERMEEQKKEKEKFAHETDEHKKRIERLKKLMEETEISSGTDEDVVKNRMDKLKVEMDELKKQESHFKEKEEELLKKERLTPWNVDTLSSDGFTKTIINKPKEKTKKIDEESFSTVFMNEHEEDIKKFGMLKDYDASSNFLKQNPHLVCEATANYLTIWCITLECQEKHNLMKHVARQTILMQYVLELGKQLSRDPRACFAQFFQRIKHADKQYLDAMEDEHQQFMSRVRERAKIRMEKIMKEIEDEERQKRLGPGGLDPVEVFESLPEKLQQCFEKKDIPMLQKALAELPKEEAEYHLKRCIDSGMWIPDAKSKGINTAESEENPYDALD
jgi:cell division cycle protein 37